MLAISRVISWICCWCGSRRARWFRNGSQEESAGQEGRSEEDRGEESTGEEGRGEEEGRAGEEEGCPGCAAPRRRVDHRGERRVSAVRARGDRQRSPRGYRRGGVER